MAIKKSNYTGGNGRLVLPSPYVANVVTEELVIHRFTETVAAGDILELAYLPPYCRVLDATVFGVGVGTVDIGFMDGEVGSIDESRTAGTELFEAVATGTETPMTLEAVAAADKIDAARSIGVTPAAEIAADPEAVLILRITYATGVNPQVVEPANP